MDQKVSAEFSDRSFSEPSPVWSHGHPRLWVLNVPTEMLALFARLLST